VDVSELFHDFPARRKFLKSSSAESALCRGVLVDRAAAHPAVSFRLFSDGDLKLFFPPSSETERICLCYSSSNLDGRVMGTGTSEGGGFTVRVVAADPGVRRRDRKLMQAFVNRRRVPEYSLLQAAEHGYSGFMPGGWFPAVFVFVEIDPSLVDFNIHPAKREVRFRNLPEVHAAVVRAVRTRLGSELRPAGSGLFAVGGIRHSAGGEVPSLPAGPAGSQGSVRSLLEAAGEPLAQGTTGVALPARYLGQVFGVFLAFEREEGLVFLDQHAAHEKVIFQSLAEQAPQVQEMLFPVSFDASEEEAARLAERAGDLEALGIVVRRAGRGTFEIVALASVFSRLPEADLVGMIRESAGQGAEWRRDLAATAACRLAVKEGDPVDPVMAAELFRQALLMENPRCPHGRPLWYELGKGELFRGVDRPVI
jgi:DNA mismatch repair protein MutL